MAICERCGRELSVGDWPFCGNGHDHGKSVQTTPFVTYFDVGLGREITSLGDRWNAMKAQPGDHHTEGTPRLEYRDHPTKGELAARRDRLEQKKREQPHG